ncbi:hypothetical protein C8F01DRAFT_787112 [Mycena amicta]|nr:hypothetical protein C8F01DRAFT_787112 [Mycena amicta]
MSSGDKTLDGHVSRSALIEFYPVQVGGPRGRVAECRLHSSRWILSDTQCKRVTALCLTGTRTKCESRSCAERDASHSPSHRALNADDVQVATHTRQHLKRGTGTMFSWLWKSSPPPSGVHIIPCTGIDLNARDLVMTTAFILDGRLDAKQLETSLSLLVESKFPRAGARLVKRDGRYEFHIPQSFDAKTRAVSFTSEHRPEPYESPSRPSLTNLCYSSVTRPFVCEAPALQPFFRAPGCPNALEGFLKLNTPLVHVHVATFEDLTFIGVTSSHTMFDAIGTQTLIHAWTRILSGEPVHDIPGMPWDVEPFATFTTPPRGWHQRGWFNLGLVSTAWFIVLFVLRLVRDAKETMKYVRVPKTFLDDEKRNITEELKSMGSEEWVGSSLGLVD